MAMPMEILARTDWSALEHAYGCADDLPERLVGLLSGDADLAGGALADLDAGVLHQGTIYSCTAPVALFVAAVLGDARTELPCQTALPWDDRVRPLRAALLEWLGDVGDSTAYSDGIPDPDEAEQACQAIRAELYRAVAPFIWNPVASVRIAALRAAGHLLRAPDLGETREALAGRLLEDTSRTDPVERAHLAFTLDGWDIPPRQLLSDPDERVRAYAAVAAGLDGDPVALAEVRAALREPGAIADWFDDDEDPQQSGWFLQTLVQALLRRTTTFEEVEPEATVIAAEPGGYARDRCLEDLLPRALQTPSEAGLRFQQSIGRP
ncbi:hypothetical protein OHA72_43565 [Dactylosporangium sp. NBC_01737]|uniref:hypothetical protein n=1 Tax=Dactylosporangium sp. NBC_01737 TaxID=2975959 RepID=UPI002E123A68|nr:hypothetical protein OHA72_43565 [Dactylosporangium sp. NBC_01737]